MKDWILVYVYNAVTNGIIDKMIVKRNIVQYPVRLLPKLFNIHILFDFFVYPTITVMYNQITYKNKPLLIFYKLLYFTIPMLLLELWAEKKTDLIKWNKGWKWYHTLITITIKSSITRSVIGLVRYLRQRRKQKKEREGTQLEHKSI
ncbi:CBO0543 family protein [Halalkalibacter lacteus]|uniref:CBO0543 family protein n=1 Tax=Halalkalibacter lacteus TaxID=3090663 RepID=UPI002FC6E099